MVEWLGPLLVLFVSLIKGIYSENEKYGISSTINGSENTVGT